MRNKLIIFSFIIFVVLCVGLFFIFEKKLDSRDSILYNSEDMQLLHPVPIRADATHLITLSNNTLTLRSKNPYDMIYVDVFNNNTFNVLNATVKMTCQNIEVFTQAPKKTVPHNDSEIFAALISVRKLVVGEYYCLIRPSAPLEGYAEVTLKIE